MPLFKLSNHRPLRLVPDSQGRHEFGGRSPYSGLVPTGTDTPVQNVVSLDLADPLTPVETEIGLSKLPLLYPFKYGCGGPDIQYTVLTDSEIEILHLSDGEPDEAEEQYLQVEELPSARMALKPLSYEEARILGFMSADAYFQPNDDDREILDQLDVNNLVEVGGFHPQIPNAGDIFCHNPKCEFHERRVYFDAIVLLPPLPINGDDEFWHQFQGGGVTFCFGFCRYCGTVIAFNVTS